MKKLATRSLTFESSVLAEMEAEEKPTAEAKAEADEEVILRPPLSASPALLMTLGPRQPTLPSEDALVPVPTPTPESSGSDRPKGGPTPPNSLEPSPEPTVNSDESKQSRNSRRSKYSVTSSMSRRRSVNTVGTEGSMRELDRTFTQQTLDSQVDHTVETLRARLGVRSGMVSGKILHDAAVALGLTRFSEQDVNVLLNRLAAPWF